MYTPEKDALVSITRTEFRELHSRHWGIECYHSSFKQVCGIIGKFMVSQCALALKRLVPLKRNPYHSVEASYAQRLRQEKGSNWRSSQR
jgi:hypothetical protein